MRTADATLAVIDITARVASFWPRDARDFKTGPVRPRSRR